jgi:FMN reductase
VRGIGEEMRPSAGEHTPVQATTPRLVIISAGTSEPSTTRMLAGRVAQHSVELLREMGLESSVGAVELAPLAVDIARAMVSQLRSDELQAVIDRLATADGVIASSPVYKAGVSGLFKSFVDLLDDDLLIAKPVVLAATAGSSRHALVVDEQMRSLFAYMRALTLPTSVFAASEDWGASDLSDRIKRAATELAVLVDAQTEQRIADRGWAGYQHEFAGDADRAERTAADVDFDSRLMRLAAGGRSAAATPSSTSEVDDAAGSADRTSART